MLTGAKCSPNFVHWTYDTWALGHGSRAAMLEQGGKTWFFITADYAFGTGSREAGAPTRSTASGGKVLGAVRHPIGTTDFSSFLLQAQASGAEVVALANAGGDTVNTHQAGGRVRHRRQAEDRGADLRPAARVRRSASQTAQGLTRSTPFYWDMNDGTRAWSKRYQARHPKKKMPNDMQAGVYSAVLHYLKAVDKVGSPTTAQAVVAAMKAMPTDDPLFGKGTIRADGRKIHPMYLLQVKTPADSKGEWDVFKVVGTIPADKAFRPLNDGGCPLVKG